MGIHIYGTRNYSYYLMVKNSQAKCITNCISLEKNALNLINHPATYSMFYAFILPFVVVIVVTIDKILLVIWLGHSWYFI